MRTSVLRAAWTVCILTASWIPAASAASAEPVTPVTPAASGASALRATAIISASPAVLNVSIAMTTDPAFIIDANNCANAGPHAAYVGYSITNTSGTAITGVRATVSGVGNGFTMIANQNPQIYVGTLNPGVTRYVYWLLGVPCIDQRTNTLTLTVTNTANDSKTQVSTIHAEGANSASAGGNVAGTLLGPGAIVGETVFMDATYTFGNVKIGDDYNLQPVGNADFAADCLVLTSNVITASQVPSIPVGTAQRLFFPATADQGGNSNTVTVRWYFKYMCAGVSSVARPYATSLSGNKFKYSGNFDSGGGTTGGGGTQPTIPPAANPFNIAGATVLSVASTLLSNAGTVTYTLTINNSSAYDATLDSLAIILPAGVAYAGIATGSNVTVANSDETPAAGATGRIVFRGIPNTSYYIAPNGSVILNFTATVSGTPKSYVASGFGYAGSTSLSGGNATVKVGADVGTTLTGPTSGIVGTTIKYVMTTTNVGPASATAVVPKLTLPAGLTFVSGTRTGTVAGSDVTFPAAAIGINATVVDTVTVSVTTTGAKTVIASSAATSSDSLTINHNGSQANAQVTTTTIALSVTTRSVTTTTVNQLPGSSYTAQYVARNTSSIAASFSLTGASAASSGPFLSATSIAGTGLSATGPTGSITLSAGDSVIVTVGYAVATGPAANENLRLTATSTLVPSVTSNASFTVRRTTPQMMLARSVDQGLPRPGDDVTFTIETQNIGENLASLVSVRDSLGAPLQFKLASEQQAMLGGLSANVQFSLDNVSWTYVPASGACSAPTGYDGCVRFIRWNIVQSVPVTAGTNRAGVFRYVARVR